MPTIWSSWPAERSPEWRTSATRSARGSPPTTSSGRAPHYVEERYYFAKSPRDVNKAVDISDYTDRKVDALCEHVCQMEMTVADLKLQLAASGLDIPMLGGADSKEFRPVIEAQIKAWAGSL